MKHERMSPPNCLPLAAVVSAILLLAAPALAQWNGFARDAQHTAQSPVAAQGLNRIIWSTPVDLAPQLIDGDILIHYGSPLVTGANTVIVPVKTGAAGGFRVEAHAGADGTLIWSLPTDYVLPPYALFTPVFGPVLSSKARLYFPGIGGTLYFRDNPDTACSRSRNCPGQLAFFGMKNYRKHREAYNANVVINTPLSADSTGNIYFGFLVLSNSVPHLRDAHNRKLSSGIARIDSKGKATWISVTAAAADQSMTGVGMNCAPAFSADLKTVYVSVSDGKAGYLLALNSRTLAPIARVRLKDPESGRDATLSIDTSTTPTVGPDGDVYYGVVENPCCENHHRGWLLHFDSTLAVLKTPGAFGYDTTVSIVPVSMIPSYSGASSYLVMTKYNNYANIGGDGMNKIAILDPNATETDPISGFTVMNEVRTILGPTPNSDLPGVREWCINSGVVDPATGAALVNNEDGKLYRWNLSANVLSESVTLTAGIGEAYTPTVVGVDGTVYAINNATLFAVGN